MAVDTDAPEADNRSRFVYVTAALAALNGLLLGFDTGIISGVFPYTRNAFTVTPLVESIIVGGALADATLGATPGGYLADRWGRRRLILVSTIALFIGSLMMAIVPTVRALVVRRLIDGVATGLTSIVGPLYLSEIVPPKICGSLVSLNQLAVTVGILSSYFVNYAFADGGQWYQMFGTGMIPTVILAVGMVFVSESPRWLVEHNRESKARDVFSRIRADDQIRAGLAEINETIEAGDDDLLSFLEPWMHPTLVVGVSLAVLQRVTDINTVIYYVPTILESTGFESSASILATADTGIVNVVMIVVAVVLIDRRGRRPLLLVGLAGMILMLVALGTVPYLPGLSGFIDTVTTGSLMLYVAFFVVGLGPVPWLLISRIYPLKVHGTAMDVVTVFNWVANFAVSLVLPVMVAEVATVGTFWMFAALSVVALTFTYRFVLETKGRSLKAIESDLRESVLGGSLDGSSAGTVSDDD